MGSTKVTKRRVNGKTVGILLRDADYARIARQAKRAGISPTELGRDLLLAALRGPEAKGTLRRAVLDLARKVDAGRLS